MRARRAHPTLADLMKKRLAIVFVAAGLLAMLCFGYLNVHYAKTLPREPVSATGRVYPLNVHGTVVYLTKNEERSLWWMFNGGIAVAIAGGALWRSKKLKP
jgi:hypothetical protein